MTGSANGVVLGKQLESATNKTKAYVLRELLTLSQAVASDIANLQGGGNVLDTVPATVNGGMWYELEDSAPVIKFFYNDNSYKITPVALRTPSLSVSPASINVVAGQTASTYINYNGDGALYVIASNIQGITASIVSSRVDVSAVGSAPAGNYTITVGAKAGATCNPVSIIVNLNVSRPVGGGGSSDAT